MRGYFGIARTYPDFAACVHRRLFHDSRHFAGTGIFPSEKIWNQRLRVFYAQIPLNEAEKPVRPAPEMRRRRSERDSRKNQM